jgi:secondary thiamine-phosphate synthase enzyme
MTTALQYGFRARPTKPAPVDLNPLKYRSRASPRSVAPPRNDRVMRQAQHTLTVATRGKGLVEVTDDVRKWVAGQGITNGLLTLFCRHTSASLIIQENADPDVRTDLETFFEDVAPETRDYIHDTEGTDDMPAHIRTALTGVQLSIPVAAGKPMLGTWQGIYVFEHRTRPHKREVVLHLLGE